MNLTTANIRHVLMASSTCTWNVAGRWQAIALRTTSSARATWRRLAPTGCKLPQGTRGGSCHKIGSETVNGRSTVKYEGTNAKGETSNVWVDPKLRFPVKWEGKNGSWELRNIQEGTQPASLFEIPADYKKFDMGNMGGMMQRPQ